MKEKENCATFQNISKSQIPMKLFFFNCLYCSSIGPLKKRYSFFSQLLFSYRIFHEDSYYGFLECLYILISPDAYFWPSCLTYHAELSESITLKLESTIDIRSFFRITWRPSDDCRTTIRRDSLEIPKSTSQSKKHLSLLFDQ
jgi:hypothetical protein